MSFKGVELFRIYRLIPDNKSIKTLIYTVGLKKRVHFPSVIPQNPRGVRRLLVWSALHVFGLSSKTAWAHAFSSPSPFLPECLWSALVTCPPFFLCVCIGAGGGLFWKRARSFYARQSDVMKGEQWEFKEPLHLSKLLTFTLMHGEHFSRLLRKKCVENIVLFW